MDSPVFLICSERSGSNLFRAIMNSHGEVCAPPPPHLINFFMPLLHHYGNLNAEANRAALAADMVTVMEKQLGSWQAIPAAEEILLQSKANTFFALIEAAYAIEAKANQKSKVFIKDNGVVRFAPQLLLGGLNAKFVHLVRDPRDVALSWMKSPAHYGGCKAAARMWQREQAMAMQFAAATHHLGCIKLIRYEALLDEPEAVVQDVCNFLKLDFDPQMLNFHESQQEKTEHQKVDNWRNLATPLIKGNHGKWRQAMSRRNVKQIEGIAFREMNALDYPAETIAKPPSDLMSLRTVGRVARQARSVVRLSLGGSKKRAELASRAARLRTLAAIESKVKNQQPKQ